MRLPLVPPIETRDGTSEKDGLCKNILMDQDEQGDFATLRPGLVGVSAITGAGKGLVTYNDQLLSVYGSTLTFSASLSSVMSVTGSFFDFAQSPL